MILEGLEIRFAIVLVLGLSVLAYFYVAPASKTFINDGALVEITWPNSGRLSKMKLGFDRHNMRLGDFVIHSISADSIEFVKSHREGCVLKADGSGQCFYLTSKTDLVWRVTR